MAGASIRTVPSYGTAALRVFDLALGEMLWSRRSVFLALVTGGPVLVALIIRILSVLDVPALRINGVPVAGPVSFGLIFWFLYLRFILPILGIFYGTALIADEVDDKTITYLFVRPIPRGAVLLGKYLAYLACTVLIVLPSIVVVFFLVVPIGSGSIAQSFPALVKDLGLVALGLLVYGAVFAFIGAQLKRPLLFGLFFVFGWEFVTLALPGYLKKFTVAYYLQSLAPHTMPQDSALTMLQAIFRDQPAVWTSVVTLLIITGVFLALAVRAVERREYVLEQ
jgi:ABC-type transport system involved in multi-copper enzyme maturation permease subunit